MPVEQVAHYRRPDRPMTPYTDLSSDDPMITTSFAYGDSYGIGDRWGYDEREHDDLMTADDYDARAAARDGWQTAHWDGRW